MSLHILAVGQQCEHVMLPHRTETLHDGHGSWDTKLLVMIASRAASLQSIMLALWARPAK